MAITVTLSQPAEPYVQMAKGRNGYFAPREISVWGFRTEPKRIAIDVRSKQTYGDPPITLYLTLENAGMVVAAIERAIAEAKEGSD